MIVFRQTVGFTMTAGVRFPHIFLAAALAATPVVVTVQAAVAEDRNQATVNSWLPQVKSSRHTASKGAWAKVCDAASATQPVPICRLVHERLDSKTARLIVSAEFWDVIGKSDEKTLVVRVVPGFVESAGMRLGFYDSDEWNLMRDDREVDQSKLKILPIKPIVCGEDSCKGQVRIGSSLWNEIKGKAGFMVLAMQSNRKPVAFPVPMAGFKDVLSGGATKGYEQAREKLISAIKRGEAP